MRKRSESTRGIEPVRLNDDENQIDANKVPFKQRIVLRLKRLLTSLRLFIYNKSTQTIFGTTSTSWLKISIYYLLFYICLALFYCGMVAVFGAIVSRGVPTYSDSNSEMAIDGVVHPGSFGIEILSLILFQFRTFFSFGLSTNADYRCKCDNG